MSSHDETVYLKHMRDYAQEACQLASGRSRADLDADRTFMLATTRLLEMMGEAARRLSDDTRLQYPQIPWQEAIGLRHHLVHGYDKINLDVIWEILTVDLAPLIAALDSMLNPPSGA
jgi:uncharacterized protein with HEPN domain